MHGFVIYYQCVLQKQFWVLKQGVKVFLVLRKNKREASCIDEALTGMGGGGGGGKGCLFSEFHFMCCRYFLGHVACRNLPCQGLIDHISRLVGIL